jgi:hypothetical protein
MASKGERRLKVFQAQLGFFDTIVAAPSQAAALRAWGVHQNLFADGQARVADDPPAIAAALAQPGIPLRRAPGSQDPFAREAASLPRVPDAPKTAKGKGKTKGRTEAAAAAPPRPPADRSALDAAEAALRHLDHDRRAEEAAFRQRQEALDADREAAQAAYVARHEAVGRALAAARAAYRKAGGTAGT